MTVVATHGEQTSAPTGAGVPADAPGEHGAPGAAERHGPLTPPPRVIEACPLCGASLAPEQDWCMNCGAAARTRLAATPSWKAPIATAAVIAALALGVLAAALVKLAGDSGSSAASAPATTTVTVAPTPTVGAPAATTTTPGAALTPTTSTTAPPLPGAASTTPGAAAAPGVNGSTTVRTAPGGRSATTITPAQRAALRQLLNPQRTR